MSGRERTHISPEPAGVVRASRELWQYRELLAFFVWRDLKLRYRHTAFGVLWAVAQPLAATAVLWTVFARGADAALLPAAYIGLLLWTYFSSSVIGSANSLIGSGALITKAFFPRLLLPLSAVMVATIDFAVAALLVAPIVLLATGSLSLHLLFVLLGGLVTLVLATGVGVLLAAVTVQFRDVRHTLPYALQLLLLATPSVYLVGTADGGALAGGLNPIAAVIRATRGLALGGGAPDGLAVSLLFGVGLLVVAIAVFARLDRRLADIV